MSSGYACPVCAAPQRDERHLANHLAFTAMLRGADHEEWLDEHVPGWSGGGPDELAERVGEFAETTEYEEVFEDTVARSAASGRGNHGDTVHDHGGHDHPERGRPSVDAEAQRDRTGSGGRATGEAAAVLEEARRMTEEMHAGEEEAVVGEDGTVGGGAGDGDGDRDGNGEGDGNEDGDGNQDGNGDGTGSAERSTPDGAADEGQES